MKCALACIGVSVALLACSFEQAESITREDLFILQIGRLEDQIAFYNQEGDQGARRSDLCMRDGIFYISDGAGQKLARYNSYGNILSMIYNDETNPQPLTLKPKPENETVTRWAFTYPLREPGRIAVDVRKHIYVEDRLPDERYAFDAENKVLLTSVVLHFDAEGRFLEYLGREGIGGSPFPRIEGLYSSADDHIAVVCRLPGAWNVYWFDAEGMLLSLIKISNDAIPIPADRRGLVFASLDSIMAAPDAHRLYIKVDYYHDTFDESTNTRTGNESDSSVIWVMNVEDGSYEKTIEAPLFETSFTEGSRKVVSKIAYSMLGLAVNERVFLSFPSENGYTIQILDTRTTGGTQHQGFIKVALDELQFNVFHLSREGILSALLIDDWDVKLVWWRTDKLIGRDE
jgi:hypothetical protein